MFDFNKIKKITEKININSPILKINDDEIIIKIKKNDFDNTYFFMKYLIFDDLKIIDYKNIDEHFLLNIHQSLLFSNEKQKNDFLKLI